MPSAGELLLQERLRRNRTLTEIAEATCISCRYLEAIEKNNLKILPGDFFYRSYIKQYAKALELDAAATSEIFATLAPLEQIDILPRLNMAYEVAAAERRSSRRAQRPTLVAAALLVSVMAGSSGVLAWYYQRQTEAEAAAERSLSAPAQTVQAASEVSKPVEVEPPAPVEVAKRSVDLAANEQTWVSLSSEGKTVFKGLIDPGESRNFEIAQNAKLLTANAAGVEVRFNGKPIGPIGPRGKMRVVVFTEEEFEILQPRRL